MQRLLGTQRPGWERIVMDQGLIYNATTSPEGQVFSYWQEGPYYSLTRAEVESLEGACATIFQMCVDAGDYIVANPRVMDRMGIPRWAHQEVIRSWNVEPARGSVYGRFDLRFGGHDHPDHTARVPQLYEFNADTPTCLLEAGWAQWSWLTQTGQGKDQWNFIWEKLIQAWQRNLALITEDLGHRPLVHFTASGAEPSGEDVVTTLYLLDTCRAAGYEAKAIHIEQIVLGDADGRFYDPDGQHLDVCFKLYPWEHMLAEEFGRPCVADLAHTYRGPRHTRSGTVWVEPPYKMLWSNKGLLAVLWQLFHNDPDRSRHLIPAWFDGEQPAGLTDYVRKPLLGREGGSVTVVRRGQVVEQVDSDYGAEGFVVQALAPPAAFPAPDGPRHPVLGAWMIDGEPAGLGIRESRTLVTDDQSFFVPHSIGDGPRRYQPEALPVPVDRSPQDAPSPQDLPSYVGFGVPRPLTFPGTSPQDGTPGAGPQDAPPGFGHGSGPAPSTPQDR